MYEAINSGRGWLNANMKQQCLITAKAIYGKYTPKPRTLALLDDRI